MLLFSRFIFDHEPDDSQRVSAQLERFKELGIELGATVTVYRCFACDIALATFENKP